MSRNHKAARWSGAVVTRARTIWLGRMKAAEAKNEPYICPKCKKPVLSTQRWDVGHKQDIDDGGVVLDLSNTTPEHSSCNRADGARITNAKKRSNLGRTRSWL